MGAEEAAIQSGIGYTHIIMGGSLVIMLLFLINGIFRGAGDAMMAMKSLWLANICNIILCPLLIRGLGPVPAFGLQGAAMATTIGRGIGVCYQLYHLFNGKSLVQFTVKHLRPDWTIIRSLISIAWPAPAVFDWLRQLDCTGKPGVKQAIAMHLPVTRLAYASSCFFYCLHGD